MRLCFFLLIFLVSNLVEAQITRETIARDANFTIDILYDYDVDYMGEDKKSAIRKLVERNEFQVLDSFDINQDGYWDYLVNEGGEFYISKDSARFERYGSRYLHNKLVFYEMAKFEEGNLIKYFFGKDLSVLDTMVYEWKFGTLVEKFDVPKRKIKFDSIEFFDEGCFGCEWYRMVIYPNRKLKFYKKVFSKEDAYTTKMERKDFNDLIKYTSWVFYADLPRFINSGVADAGSLHCQIYNHGDTVCSINLYNGISDYFSYWHLDALSHSVFLKYQAHIRFEEKEQPKKEVYKPVPKNYTIGWWQVVEAIPQKLTQLLYVDIKEAWLLHLYDDFCHLEKVGDFTGESQIKHDRKTYYYLSDEIDCSITLGKDSTRYDYGLVCSSLLEDPKGQNLRKSVLIGQWEVLHTQTRYPDELDLNTGFWNGILEISWDYSIYKADRSGLFKTDLNYSLKGEYLLDEKTGFSYVHPYLIDEDHLIIFLGETDFIYLKRLK